MSRGRVKGSSSLQSHKQTSLQSKSTEGKTTSRNKIQSKILYSMCDLSAMRSSAHFLCASEAEFDVRWNVHGPVCTSEFVCMILTSDSQQPHCAFRLEMSREANGSSMATGCVLIRSFHCLFLGMIQSTPK